MKLYYDDAIEAAYMLKNFVPKLWMAQGFAGNRVYIKTNERDLIEDWFKWKHPIYVYPDSLPIFEPQVGDYIASIGEEYYKGVCIVDGKYTLGSHEGIIQRNGKAFIMPKQETTETN